MKKKLDWSWGGAKGDGVVGSLFLDSGAHSLYNKLIHGKGRKAYDFFETPEFWEYVDSYAEFVKANKAGIDYYVNVDVIFNPEASWRVLKYLEEKHKLNPLPVIHHGEDLKWVKKHVDAGYDYIGLGGLGQAVTRDMYYQWADVVYDYLCPPPKRLPIVKTHGFAMTAHALMVRYPWYCMTPDHEVLTKEGWKGAGKVKIGDEVLAFDDGLCEWQPVMDVPIFDVEDIPLVEMHSKVARDFSARITPNHRWRVQNRRGEWSWQTTDSLNNHLIPKAGYYEGPLEKTYSDELVDLFAWYWTEGSVYKRPRYKKPSIRISQSQSANPKKVEMIRAALVSSGEKYCEWVSRRKDGRAEVTFELYGELRDKLLEMSPEKTIPLPFLLKLTRKQLKRFVHVSILADGHYREIGRPYQRNMRRTIGSQKRRRSFGIAQADGSNIEEFRIACLLAGISTNEPKYSSPRSKNHRPSVAIGSSHKKVIASSRIRKTNVKYTGKIWCIRVKSGAFFTRCNGRIYVTGNSVDSASWVKAGGFGQIFVPHKRKGKFDFSVPAYSLSVSAQSPTTEKADRNIANMRAAEKKIVLEWLDQIGLPLGKVDKAGEMAEWGVVSNHHARRIANLLYFEGLVAWLPEWPWPFKVRRVSTFQFA